MSFFSLVEITGIFFHVLIETVKIDICQYRTYYTSLRCSRKGVMVFPIFNVTSIQELTDESEKSFVRDSFPQNSYQYIVVDVVEESFDVSLYEPLCTFECFLYAG